MRARATPAAWLCLAALLLLAASAATGIVLTDFKFTAIGVEDDGTLLQYKNDADDGAPSIFNVRVDDVTYFRLGLEYTASESSARFSDLFELQTVAFESACAGESSNPPVLYASDLFVIGPHADTLVGHVAPDAVEQHEGPRFTFAAPSPPPPVPRPRSLINCLAHPVACRSRTDSVDSDTSSVAAEAAADDDEREALLKSYYRRRISLSVNLSVLRRAAQKLAPGELRLLKYTRLAARFVPRRGLNRFARVLTVRVPSSSVFRLADEVNTPVRITYAPPAGDEVVPESERDTCAICLDYLRMTPAERAEAEVEHKADLSKLAVLQKCAHIFHHSCLEMALSNGGSNDDDELGTNGWFPTLSSNDEDEARRKRCPTCRHPIETRASRNYALSRHINWRHLERGKRIHWADIRLMCEL